MTGASNGLSCKNNAHIPGISIHYFLKDVAVWPNGRVSNVDIEEILPFKCFLCSVPALKAAVTNIYHQTNQGKITKESSLKGC